MEACEEPQMEAEEEEPPSFAMPIEKLQVLPQPLFDESNCRMLLSDFQ